MFVFKTSGETIGSVVKNEKHAFRAKPKEWQYGEIVLLSKNKKDLISHEKQIQYIALIDDIYTATQEEIEEYWPGNGGRWFYIVSFSSVKKLSKPFNLEDILPNPHKNYGHAMTFSKIDPRDEKKILEVLKRQGVL